MKTSLPKKQKMKMIVFDVDGVLADTKKILFEIHRLVRPTMTAQSFEQLWNGNIYKVKFKERKVRDINYLKEIHLRYKKVVMHKQVKRGIQLLAKEFPLSIISSTGATTITNYLQKHGVRKYFLEILGPEVHKSKTHKFALLCKKYAIHPDELIFITDTAGDIYEAKKARVGTIIGILGGYQKEKSLKKARPQYIVKNFPALLKRIL